MVQNSVFDLPHVSERTFWNVRSTGNPDLDIALGRHIAAQVVEHTRRTGSDSVLQSTLMSIAADGRGTDLVIAAFAKGLGDSMRGVA